MRDNCGNKTQCTSPLELDEPVAETGGILLADKRPRRQDVRSGSLPMLR